MRAKIEQQQEEKKKKQESKTKLLYEIQEHEQRNTNELESQKQQIQQINDWMKQKLQPTLQNIASQFADLKNELEQEKAKSQQMKEVPFTGSKKKIFKLFL